MTKPMGERVQAIETTLEGLPDIVRELSTVVNGLQGEVKTVSGAVSALIDRLEAHEDVDDGGNGTVRKWREWATPRNVGLSLLYLTLLAGFAKGQYDINDIANIIKENPELVGIPPMSVLPEPEPEPEPEPAPAPMPESQPEP